MAGAGSAMNIEFNRLLSFVSWDTAMFGALQSLLAMAGFYFTGIDDIVVCFCCGICLKSWKPSCRPMNEHRLASPDCPYIRSMDNTDSDANITNNISMDDLFRYESARLRTFLNWPQAQISATELAQAGFYYLGSGFKVKCAFCKGVLQNLEPGDSAIEKHQRHFPNCAFVQANVGNVAGLPSPRHMAEGESKVRPEHPEFESMTSRLPTFHNWPRTCTQTSAQLAEAGFVFTGIEDIVRCFFCGGCLTQWQPGEDPWEEHARWFPECGYLEVKKGQAFIEGVKRKYAAINALADADGPMAQGGLEEGSNDDDMHEDVDDDDDDDDEFDPDIRQLLAELERLKEERNCKVCMERDMSVVFLPCSHMVCCSICAYRLPLPICPVCRSVIWSDTQVRFEDVYEPYYNEFHPAVPVPVLNFWVNPYQDNWGIPPSTYLWIEPALCESFY